MKLKHNMPAQIEQAIKHRLDPLAWGGLPANSEVVVGEISSYIVALLQLEPDILYEGVTDEANPTRSK